MCTVSFIPFQDQIFITSNRDENPGRQSPGLQTLHSPEAEDIHLPLDETSQGSWIALSGSGRALCLLNGAYEPFTPQPPYRQSRGKVVVDAAAASSFAGFTEAYNFNGIAPFTLLAYENDSLTEIIWDGQSKNISGLSTTQPMIWSSVTLYPADVRKWRRSFFEEWIHAHKQLNRDVIIDFHQIRRGDGQNDFIMNRDEIVKTLSVTSIALKKDTGSIVHLDLEKNMRQEILIRYGH
jgi:hypothetical protein